MYGKGARATLERAPLPLLGVGVHRELPLRAGRELPLLGVWAHRDRTAAVPRPLRPGTHVQRGRDARDGERQYLVGGGHARAAVDADLRSAGHTEGLEALRELARWPELAGLRDVLRGRRHCLHVPAHGVDRLDLAPIAAPPARASSSSPVRASAAAPSASSSGRAPATGSKVPRAGSGTSEDTGPLQTASPPSSTRTDGCPVQPSSHQARAAAHPTPPSYTTTSRSSDTPAARIASPKTSRSGSGWRPPSPGSPASSASRSTKTAPGMCPAA